MGFLYLICIYGNSRFRVKFQGCFFGGICPPKSRMEKRQTGAMARQMVKLDTLSSYMISTPGGVASPNMKMSHKNESFWTQKEMNHLNQPLMWANYSDQPAEVTPNGGLVRESSQNPLNSGLGIIVICPD